MMESVGAGRMFRLAEVFFHIVEVLSRLDIMETFFHIVEYKGPG
jgi:hypothetical protein